MSHHENLVQIYGFCDHYSHKLLIYKYITNGSLDRILFVKSSILNWRMCIQIPIGTTCGILYLHEECTTQIMHYNIKPKNILLNNNYNPKIADLGLAKLMKAVKTF